MADMVFSDFPVSVYTNNTSVQKNNIQTENKKDNAVTTPQMSRKEKIIHTAKTIAPVVIPLAAIPLTALITYKIASKNTKALTDTIKNLSSELNKVKTDMSGVKEAVEDAGKKIASQSENVQKLDNKIGKIALTVIGAAGSYQAGKVVTQSQDANNNRYQQLIENPKLSYDPLTPPVDEQKDTKYYKKIYKYNDLSKQVSQQLPDKYTSDLITTLQETGEINIPAVLTPNSTTDMEKASINTLDESTRQLGKQLPIGMSTEYGKRTNWSNEKISRDIFQNFFDANNHSLDGIGFNVKREGNKYKVKITGNSVFDCKALLELGSGNKLDESPYNAGGFGEGSRLVVASLLGQGKSDNVKFASADWELTFSQKNHSILRKLEKSQQINDGNYIEFETSDEEFVNSLIKSINYFDNAHNLDYQNLNYDSKDFGFKILPKGEKGNLYLTQRFEYNQPGLWEQGLEGITLIFKRKPDNEEYKKLTNKDFSKGRDRIYFTGEEIYDLTRYFAKDMSNEDLINSILQTKVHWTNNTNNGEKPAINYFINALCDEAKRRYIGIDFSKEKICIVPQYFYGDKSILDDIRNMGYTIITSDLALNQVGMETVQEVLKKTSNHTPLQPTEVEIKKIKLLDAAASVIQRAINQAYSQKIMEIYSSIKNKILSGELKINEPLTRLDIIGLVNEYANDPDLKNKLNCMSEEFTEDLIKYLDDEIQNSQENNSKSTLMIANVLSKLLPEDSQEAKQINSDLKHLLLILPNETDMPKYIFDRKAEIAKDTLGEAIIGIGNRGKIIYKGHWVDKTYLNNGNFYDLVATWLHEISHKSGGDGTSEFTYTLTDLIEALVKSGVHVWSMQTELEEIEKVFNSL